MKRTLETKFACFAQNNSGGYYIKDETAGIGIYVVIEGTDLDDINKRANIIFEEFSSYCPCCGKRWYEVYSDDLCDYPCDTYAKPFSSLSKELKTSWAGKSGYIHYMDGTIQTFADYINNIKAKDKFYSCEH